MRYRRAMSDQKYKTKTLVLVRFLSIFVFEKRTSARVLVFRHQLIRMLAHDTAALFCGNDDVVSVHVT
jgi:hypothetical protein